MSENINNSLAKKEVKPSELLAIDTLIIKAKFKFQSAGVYGIFAVILRTDLHPHDFYDNMTLNPFLELHILVSYFSDIFHTDLERPWSSLEQTFNDMFIKGSHATTITETFQKGIYEVLINNPDTCFRMIDDYKEKRIPIIEKEFDSIISNIYKDRQFDIDFFYEELSSDSIASIKKKRIALETPETNTNILTTPSITINPLHFSIPAGPILAPIGEGIPSHQLSPGIRILMKIDGGTSYGLEWIEIFKAFDKDEKKILPVVGTIDQIGPIIKNSLNILVKYQEEQYTKFNIEAGIKLKLYNPNDIGNGIVDPLAIGNTYQQNSTKSFSQLFQEKSFISTLIAGGIMLVLSVIAFYFNL